MSEPEFLSWVAYYQIEPWGSELANLNAGIIASTIANCNRDPKRRREPWIARNFMLPSPFAEPKEERSEFMEPEEILSAFDNLIKLQQGNR